MKITEKNFQKVSLRVHNMRQHWLRRVRISHVVQYVAASVFFPLSIMCGYRILPAVFAKEMQGKDIGLLAFFQKLWEFLCGIFSAPADSVGSVLKVLLGAYAVSFLAAAVAAVIVSVKFKPEPKPKDKGLKHSTLSGMVTGVKIYQERIGLLETSPYKLNNIFSLVFSLFITAMVAYLFGVLGMFETNWEAFVPWAIFGTALCWVAHRLLLVVLSLPVALLYCFGLPAPGLRKALEKKKEELTPVYKYIDKQRPYIPASELIVGGSQKGSSWLKDDPYALAGDWGHVDTSDM